MELYSIFENQMKRFLSPSNTSSFFIDSFDFTVHTVYLIQSFFLFVSHVFVNVLGSKSGWVCVCLLLFPLHVPHHTIGMHHSWNCILTIPMFVESKYKYHAYGYAIQAIVQEFPCHHATWSFMSTELVSADDALHGTLYIYSKCASPSHSLPSTLSHCNSKKPFIYGLYTLFDLPKCIFSVCFCFGFGFQHIKFNGIDFIGDLHSILHSTSF